ncbi:MAG: NAD-dependent epimerase/dehydratase family protein [Gemmatimonadota bacterium]
MWSLLGGHGYVGRHLGRELRLLGEEVSVRGRADGDFRDRVEPDWLAGARAVVLLAGATRTGDADRLLDNRRIVDAVVRAMAELGPPRPPLLFFSSLHVYRPSPRPARVGDATFPSRTLYGSVKRGCERRLVRAAGDLGFPLWIGRAANLLAETAPPNPESFVGDMRRTLLAQGRLEVRRAPVRDLVRIEDLARGLHRRVASRLAAATAVIENVATGRGVRLLDLARAARRLWSEQGRRAEVVELEAGDPDVLVGEPPEDRVWGCGPDPAALAALIAGAVDGTDTR